MKKDQANGLQSGAECGVDWTLTNDKQLHRFIYTLTISITAKQEFMGNGAIAPPKEGIRFTTEMQKLLHRLLTNHGVKTIHLLPCASNAACVFFGKAFDSWHPEIIVNDFKGKQMTPSLEICNIENKCVLRSPRLN